MKTKTTITITPEGVWFDKKEGIINDSSNMSYVFENRAYRTLKLRWIGMHEDSKLPIWEFTVEKDFGLYVVCSTEIYGFGEFVYEGGKIQAVPQLSLVPKTLVAA